MSSIGSTLFLLLVTSLLFAVEAFVARSSAVSIRSTDSSAYQKRLGNTASSSYPEQLVQAVTEKKDQDDATITSLISILEASSEEGQKDDNDENRFKPLVGLYDVSFVKTSRPRDNPVGGKWTRKNGIAQKILRTRRSFQHILPVNATGRGALVAQGRTVVGEAVNVISLEALWGLLRVTVMLRGDAVPLTVQERTNTTRVAQPLTSLAVKALFDAPRIVFGRRGRVLNFSVGPRTSVLLDTLFCDDKVRIGMGGISGTRFVFARCQEDDLEANEFRSLLRSKPVAKIKLLSILAAIGLTGVYQAVKQKLVALRILCGTMAAISGLFGALVATSGGGIERDDLSIAMRKEGDAAASSAMAEAT